VVKKIARTWQDWDTEPLHLLEARAELAAAILAK
jgi:hypothetical protein